MAANGNGLLERLPDHLSFSQLNMWLRCPRQHFYRYGLGLKVPPSGAAVVGSAVHRAIEIDNKRKAVEGKPEPWEVVSDAYSTFFDEEARDAVWVTENPADAKDSGYSALREYYKRITRRIQPAGPEWIERKVELPLQGIGIPLVGIIDVRTEYNIVDYKVVRQAVNEVPNDTKLQLWLYDYALKRLGVPVPRRRVLYLVRRNNPTILLHAVEPASPSEVARWLQAMEDIRRDMEHAYATGRFLPALPGSWWCSPKWCGYWDRCHRDF